MSTPTFPHIEGELADELGLSHETLKQHRAAKLTRGVDWELVKNRIAYSADARKKTLRALRASDAAEPPGDSAPNTAAAKAPAGPIEVECVRIYVHNRQILQARAGKDLVRVRVPDNRNFRAGMKFSAHRLHDDLFKLAGKAPRWPGKF